MVAKRVMAAGYLSEAFVSFQGEGAHVGRRHLFLRFAGCPLRCRYCDTPDSLVRTPEFVVRGAIAKIEANPLTRRAVIVASKWLLGQCGNVDGVSLTGGEPLAQADFITELLQGDSLPRPRLLETSGTLPDQLEQVMSLVDLVSMDVKLPSNTGERAYWAEHERFLRIASGRVYVKILVDDDTDPDEVVRAATTVRMVDRRTPVFLQPITSVDGTSHVAEARLAMLYSLSRELIDDLRVVPQTHKMLGIR